MSMIYRYTWSHILLLANICGCKDTEETVTDNWVKMLENQHEQTFPFTLWPLTYRTSTMIASPGMSSPSILNISYGKRENKNSAPSTCEVTVKFYKSNEVLIICFQCNDNSQEILNDKTAIVKVYDKVNIKTMKVLTMFQDVEPDKELKCIICTGYGMGATFATLMAHDLAREFDDEAHFLELKAPKTSVDCVCFSMPEMGNEDYWKEFESLVDKHITIRHMDEEDITFPKSCMFIGNKRTPVPNTKALKGIPLDKSQVGTRVTRVPCERYMEDIDKKVSFMT